MTSISASTSKAYTYNEENSRCIAKAFEDCKTFLYYLDSGKGYDACSPYEVEGGASFVCQCETLGDIRTVKDYAKWMQELVNQAFQPTPQGSFTRKVLHVGYCEHSRTVAYVATLKGKTKNSSNNNHNYESTYTYLVTLSSDDGKVERVTKIWNDFYALRQAGWIQQAKESNEGHIYD